MSRKWFATLVVLVMVLGLAVSVNADTVFVPDTTLSVPYQYTAPSTYSGWTTPVDVIASNPAAWDIAGVNFSWNFSGSSLQTFGLKIVTPYPQGGITVDGVNMGQGDVFLYNGSDVFAVKMSGSNLGNVYKNPTINFAVQNPLLITGTFIYGGGFLDEYGVEHFAPASFTGGEYAGLAQVFWETGGVSILFQGTLGGLDWRTVEAALSSGGCTNEFFEGHATTAVPIPGAFLLLASGLVGLGLLDWRRKTNA